MKINDPIADILNRIHNALRARKREVYALSSKMKLALLDILKNEGYIEDYITEGEDLREKIKIFLKYTENKEPAIREIVHVSKPGRRVYKGYKEMRPVKSGMGVAIISTPEGIMTDKEARKKKIGGEIICEIF